MITQKTENKLHEVAIGKSWAHEHDRAVKGICHLGNGSRK